MDRSTALRLDLRGGDNRRYRSSSTADRDRLERYLKLVWGEASLGPDPVPITFVTMLTTEVLTEAVSDLLPPVGLERVALAHHQIRRDDPIPCARTLDHEASLVAVRQARRGVLLQLSATTSYRGHLLIDQTVTLFVADAYSIAAIGPTLLGWPRHEPSRGSRTSTVVVPADLSQSYAAVTGENLAVHVDDEVARSHGFPGVTLQGTCTLALVARALTEAFTSDGRRMLQHLSMGFAGPIFPPTDLVVRFEEATVEPTGSTQVSLAATSNGRPVVRGGVADLRCPAPT